MDKPIIENFSFDSVKPTAIGGRLNHCIDNSQADDLTEEEKKYRAEHLKENFTILGKCKSVEDLFKQIQEASDKIGTKRNKFPVKEFVMTLNIDYDTPNKVEIVKDWAKQVIKFWTDKGIKFGIGWAHLNEASGHPHLHLFILNWDLKKNKWGWELGKLKPSQVKEIHKEYDILLNNFSKKWNLDHLDRDSWKELKLKQGKHLPIWDLKNLSSKRARLKEFQVVYSHQTQQIEICYRQNAFSIPLFESLVKDKKIKIDKFQYKHINKQITDIKTKLAGKSKSK